MIWQNSFDGKNKAKHQANKPKPFIPEFMKSKLPKSPINKDLETHTTNEIDQILKMPRG